MSHAWAFRIRIPAFSALGVPVLIGLTLFPARVSAQPPTDSLNGKTIHLYVESEDFNAFYFWNGDIPLKVDSKYNYSITLSGRDIYQQDFFFASNGTRPEGEHIVWKLSKTGLDANEGPRFTVADFQGKPEMWIVVDPAGPLTAPPVILFEAPKTINILNPWATTAPKLVSGTRTRGMTTTPGHCGWFTTLLLDPALTAGHFTEVGDAGSYGKSGHGASDDYNFTALFAQYGPSLWLNTEANAWSGAYPNVAGTCQYMMAMTVRDFSKDHPDFDFGAVSTNGLLKGVVQPALGADGKPVLNPAGANQNPVVTFGTFDTWWRTDSTNATPTMRSYESCYDLPMSKTSDGLWEYDSYRDSPDHGFWPAEGTLNRFPAEAITTCYVKPPPDSNYWVTAGPKRNGNFCVESHATFVYKPGQRFAFRGDDDVWVFINGKLVVDLGGLHTPLSDSVDLDKLGLTAGTRYNWDFFACDRQPCASSLRIKTSIFFQQPRPLVGVVKPGPTPGSIAVEIWKRSGGNGSCGSMGVDPDSVKASGLAYQLLDAAGQVAKELANPGAYFNGGIVIAEPVITVDTAKLAGGDLIGGASYRVVAFEPANPKVRVEVPFRVPASTGLRAARRAAQGPRGAVRYRNLAGRRVPAPPDRIGPPLVPQRGE